MSDNGYDIWRDVANIFVNPTIKTDSGFRVPTRELAMSQKFEYYNPELKGGRKQKDDSAAAPSAAGEKKNKLPETGSFCNQKSFKFADLKNHFYRETNFRDDNDNYWSFKPLIRKIKNKDPTQVDIETYIRISKFFQKTTEDKIDDDVHSFSDWCSKKHEAIYHYLTEISDLFEALGYEREQSTKIDKQKFINKNFPNMRTNLMKVADLIRVLNFFRLDTIYLYEMITPLGGPYQPKELPYITQMKPPAFQIFIDLLEMIDDIDGYGREIALVKTFNAAKDKFENDRAALRAKKSKSSAAAVPPAPSAAAAAAPAPADDLASKHYSQRRPKSKSNRKKPGTFKIGTAAMAALKRRKTGAKTATVGAIVRGKCPFCFQDVTTAQKRTKDAAGIYYHQDCHDAKSQGWLSRVSKSTGRALYRHSEHSKTWRWEKPKVPEDSEDNIFRGGRKTKTKRKKKKQTKRPKKKQTKRRKTNKRKKKKKSKKRRK